MFKSLFLISLIGGESVKIIYILYIIKYIIYFIIKIIDSTLILKCYSLI